MPNKVGQIYVCEICGNKVEMLAAGEGQLICCGQPMKLVGEKK
jgi:superoxide reductase